MKNSKYGFKEIYKRVNHNKYSQLTNIDGKVEVKSNFKFFIYNFKGIIITTLLIFLLLIIYTFRNNPIVILYCIFFVAALFLLAMYTCTYKVNLDEKNFRFFINFQKNTIKSDDLVNIYLSREKMRFFGFPIYNYLLNIIYLDGDNPMKISFPTVMIDKKKLLKLFSIIETKKIKDEEKEEQENEKNKRLAILITISIIVIILIVSVIIGSIIYNINH